MSTVLVPEPEVLVHPEVDRALPPVIALLKLLAQVVAAPQEDRPRWAQLAVGMGDAIPDADRPLLKDWLAQWLDRRWLEGQDLRLSGGALARRQSEADALHRSMLRHAGVSNRQRRLLEQELLVRSTLPEDWYFHRAKWRYLELQADQAGNLLSPSEAARRARQAGIFFHPDQLKPARSQRWFGLRQGVELLDGKAWLDLLAHLTTGRPVDLALAPELWPHLRPWLTHLLGGQGLGLMELSMDSLPEHPGTAPARRGLLILHGVDQVPPSLEAWCQGAALAHWQVLAIQAPHQPELPWANRVEGGSAGVQWNQRRHFTSRAMQGRPLPLRDFLKGVERHYIMDVLGSTGGVKTRACECLGISRQTLYAKLAGVELEA